MIRSLFPALALATAVGLSSAATALDLELYGRLLESHTRAVDDLASTRVDYAGLRKSFEWKRLVKSLAESDPSLHPRRNEQLAFWTNAYNILAIETVVRNYPVDSIRDVGSLLRPVWKREAGRINGRPYTLDQIENEILRPLGDPRIHATIVCASLSCPPLRREPYRAETVDAQFDDNVRQWLADPRKGSALDGDAKVRVSKIFDWFEEDFEAGGGVLAFVRRYAPEPVRQRLEQGPPPRLAYFDYDWSVNDTATAG